MEKQFRNEWKFCCTQKDVDILQGRLNAIMESDSHVENNGKYIIHSLYFDDIYDTCMKENEAGIEKRYKYRIRYYNFNPDFMRLERKEKWYGRCYKESSIISKMQYSDIINGDLEHLFWSTNNKVLQKFCVDSFNRGFQAKAIVHYERVAFVEPQTNVRITLDENIEVSDEVEKFLQGDYLRIPIQKKEEQVLEVKFDAILPSYIRHILSEGNLIQSSFSKYYIGRKKIQEMGRL